MIISKRAPVQWPAAIWHHQRHNITHRVLIPYVFPPSSPHNQPPLPKLSRKPCHSQSKLWPVNSAGWISAAGRLQRCPVFGALWSRPILPECWHPSPGGADGRDESSFLQTPYSEKWPPQLSRANIRRDQGCKMNSLDWCQQYKNAVSILANRMLHDNMK